MDVFTMAIYKITSSLELYADFSLNLSHNLKCGIRPPLNDLFLPVGIVDKLGGYIQNQ